MRRYAPVSACLAVIGIVGCDDGGGGTSGPTGPYHGAQVDTLLTGATDNPESIKAIPGTDLVLALASKSRELTLLRVNGDAIEEVRSESFFSAGSDENELTNMAVSPDGQWAVLTHTLVSVTGDTVTACAGELVFVDVQDGATFGDILAQVDVGPMPDSVAVSPNGNLVASANERDVVWGKCENVENVEPPSISLLDLSAGAAAAAELVRIEMLEDDTREPESIVFSADGTQIVATLQDSHELAFVAVADARDAPSMSDADITIVDVPQNATGADAWPDGVTSIGAGSSEVFATANEASDQLSLFDRTGQHIGDITVSASDIPASFPRDGSWGPLFEPDSIVAFVYGGQTYLALTLKAAGAVGIWDITTPTSPTLSSIVKVGEHEESTAEEASSVSPEGITVGRNGAILTANEGEGSISLILPE